MALPARRLLAVHGHAARAPHPAVDVGGAARAVEGVEVTPLLARPPDLRDGRHRSRRLVPGAAPRGARSATSCASSATACRAARCGARVSRDRLTVVHGDVRDQALLERALGEYEIDTVIHLAAQTIVAIANRNPVSTFETNIARHLGAARGVPPQPRRAADRRSRRRTRPTATTRRFPTRKTRRSRAGIPTTSASRART